MCNQTPRVQFVYIKQDVTLYFRSHFKHHVRLWHPKNFKVPRLTPNKAQATTCVQTFCTFL